MKILKLLITTSFLSTVLLQSLLFLRLHCVLKSTLLHTLLGWRRGFLSHVRRDKSSWGPRRQIHHFTTRQSSEPTTKYSPPAEEKLRLSTTQKSLHSVGLISRRRGSWSEKFHVQKLSRETRYPITFVTRAPFWKIPEKLPTNSTNILLKLVQI